jgi:regulator of replication initiation timing
MSLEELLALVAQLQHQVSELQRQVVQLAASNETLQAENAELQRGAKRQATPFSKGTRVSNPKPPAASWVKAPFPSAWHHSPRRSPNLQ